MFPRVQGTESNGCRAFLRNGSNRQGSPSAPRPPAALARAYIKGELAFEDRCAAEAALTLLLDDPSSKVRQALAEALSLSPLAPPQIIAALASDQPEVAAMVLARSPLLSDLDLIERVAAGPRCDARN